LTEIGLLAPVRIPIIYAQVHFFRISCGCKKQKIILVVDEANLMRPEIFTELHTLAQFEHDSKSLLTLILCGQTSLLDKLAYRGAAPLASRVIARAHLDTLSEAQLGDYIAHHVVINIEINGETILDLLGAADQRSFTSSFPSQMG
jgi:hypothetical protein